MQQLITLNWGYSNTFSSPQALSNFVLQDNLSRGNLGAVQVLHSLFPEPDRLRFIHADLGDVATVSFSTILSDLCMLFSK